MAPACTVNLERPPSRAPSVPSGPEEESASRPFQATANPSWGGGREGQRAAGLGLLPVTSSVPPAGPPPSANPIGLLPCHFDEEDYTARHCPAGLATSSRFRISRALHAKPTKGCTCRGEGALDRTPELSYSNSSHVEEGKPLGAAWKDPRCFWMDLTLVPPSPSHHPRQSGCSLGAPLG